MGLPGQIPLWVMVSLPKLFYTKGKKKLADRSSETGGYHNEGRKQRLFTKKIPKGNLWKPGQKRASSFEQMQCLCLPVLRGCTLSLSSGSSPPPAGNGSATQQYMPFGWFQYRRMCYLPAAAVGAVKKIKKCSVLGVFSKIAHCFEAPFLVFGAKDQQ